MGYFCHKACTKYLLNQLKIKGIQFLLSEYHFQKKKD